MSQATQTYKRSLSGSVGAGINSVFGGGGKTYFVLEHKVSSKYHKAGESQEIIVDEVELGRDPKCAVRFDESFNTVSRRHAAIVRDGDNWKLVQLSHTNTTFLNGRPVQKEWYLQNGDEIQLSVNGPKLGFIIPQGNKSTVGSIGLSRRLSLFRQQAMRPYRTAIWTLAVLLLLTIGGGVWLGIQNKDLVETMAISEQERKEAEALHAQELAAAQEKTKELEEQVKKTKRDFANLQKSMSELKNGTAAAGAPNVSSGTISNKGLAACEPNVYFILMRKIELSLDGNSKTVENVGSGTGFLLNDGRFVTARHVVEPWMYPSSAEDEVLVYNAIAHNGGTVKCYLEAYSPTGARLSFVSTNAVVDRSSDKTFVEDGVTFKVPENRALDWAYFRTSGRDGLSFDSGLSKELPSETKLSVLGYPMGLGAYSTTDIKPYYSEAIVARAGLDHGYIMTTATTFEHGNSGGPVFATLQDGTMTVVGLVSAGAGRSTGMVVPISAVR